MCWEQTIRLNGVTEQSPVIFKTNVHFEYTQRKLVIFFLIFSVKIDLNLQNYKTKTMLQCVFNFYQCRGRLFFFPLK